MISALTRRNSAPFAIDFSELTQAGVFKYSDACLLLIGPVNITMNYGIFNPAVGTAGFGGAFMIILRRT